MSSAASAYGQQVTWEPEKPRIRPARVLLSWLIGAVSIAGAAWVLSGVDLDRPAAALLAALGIALINAILPPVLAALRLPYMVGIGYILVLLADALALKLTSDAWPSAIQVDSFKDAFVAALIVTTISLAIEVILGTSDDDEYSLRVTRRIAKRQGALDITDVPGIIYLEIDGLALPVLRDAMRDGSAPNMARWISEDGYRLAEWETDLSSQTGASQAGILLGSNENIPAFRWVEKQNGLMKVCSSPDDCAEIERIHSSGVGLLADGGSSRGNLLSGEAEEVILTVSRFDAERGYNPGYRAFLANGFNVTRSFVLFWWEVLIELVAAARLKRRDVRPRGHRGGAYPLIRGAMCVIVRDMIVQGVITDMMRGRPAVYATFSSYDEVAHHSGLQRPDTMEALRKLDNQFGQIENARRYARRPYEIIVLSDHGQTQGATFKQRNGYGLDELVERSLSGRQHVKSIKGGDEQSAMAGYAVTGAAGRKPKKQAKNDVSGRAVVVLGSGNLGLVYLMEAPHRLTLEQINERHPELIPALRDHPHVGWVLVRSMEHGPVVLGPRGALYLGEGRLEGEDPLANFSSTAADHLLRTDGFEDVADLMVGSFYDPVLGEGCAFEELISFHGGLGGPQTRAFILHPSSLELRDGPIIGAAAVHDVLRDWRLQLQGEAASASPAEATTAVD